MEIGYFYQEATPEDQEDQLRILCVWDNVSDVMLSKNSLGRLVLRVPVPREFTEEELLCHVYRAQEKGILLLEEKYLSLVREKFKVEIRDGVEYPLEKEKLRDKIVRWLTPFSMIAA